MTKFVRRINKTATENVKMLDRLRKKKKNSDVVGMAFTPSLELRGSLESFSLLCVFDLIWSFSECCRMVPVVQSFFSSYMGTISHLTNSYNLPCCLRPIPQFYFSIFHCYFDLFLLESYFAPCFLLLSPIRPWLISYR